MSRDFRLGWDSARDAEDKDGSVEDSVCRYPVVNVRDFLFLSIYDMISPRFFHVNTVQMMFQITFICL